uniref:Ig-like domain-containing protein n=1 Tax=Takifugu rubripes TaxID=31033 RepID=H2SYN0_TAKRU
MICGTGFFHLLPLAPLVVLNALVLQLCFFLLSSSHLHAVCFPECRTQKDTVLQPKAEEMAAEDQTVTLDCHYTSTVTDVNIFWYKQDGTSRPQFILSRFTFGKGKTEDEFKERFSSALNSTMKSVPLKIQELQLSDSAVYYCALRPTVTGSSRSAH